MEEFYKHNFANGNQDEYEIINYAINQVSNDTKLAKYDISSKNYALCEIEFDDSYRDRSFTQYINLSFTHYMNERGEIVPVGFVDKYNRFSPIDQSTVDPEYMKTVGQKPRPVYGKISSFLLVHRTNKPKSYKRTRGYDDDHYHVRVNVPFTFVDVETYKNEISNKILHNKQNKYNEKQRNIDIIDGKNREIEELKNIIYQLRMNEHEN